MIPAELSILFTPLTIGGMVVPNRVAVTAHSYNFSDAGHPLPKLAEYVLARVRGQCGLIIIGETQVTEWPAGEVGLWGSLVSSDAAIPFYSALTARARAEGETLLVHQLSHPGGQVWPEPDAIAAAPSSVPHGISGLIPYPLAGADVLRLIDAFALAARRAQLAGMHGVEVKADQGKLIHQFLSGYFNRRSDEWGGRNVIERASFLMAVLTEVRKQVGSEFIVGVRLSGESEGSTQGRPEDVDSADTRLLLPLLGDSGLVDFIDISGGTNSDPRSYWHSHGDSAMPRQSNAQLMRELRPTTSLPLIMAGRIIDVYDAADVVRAGICDMVAMTRASIADPALVRKAREGLLLSIRPCINCNQSCVGHTWEGRELRCIYNPTCGYEDRYATDLPKLAGRVEHVVIVGGGPAGMEAARVAAAAGHTVDLYEASDRLGGQLLAAAQAPHRLAFARVTKYLEAQLNGLENVEVHLEHPLDVEMILAYDPSVLVLATGGRPTDPPGSLHPPWLNPIEALSRDLSHVKRAVVIDDDWRLHALSIAEAIATSGAEVHIATLQEFVGKGLDLVSQTSYRSRLGDYPISYWPMTSVTPRSTSSVRFRNQMTGAIFDLIEVDAVVAVVNFMPCDDLGRSLRSREHVIKHVIEVGDCRFPRGLEVAMREAHHFARSLLS